MKSLHGLIGKSTAERSERSAKSKALGKKSRKLEALSKKVGFYVHGHKNLGDVYKA